MNVHNLENDFFPCQYGINQDDDWGFAIHISSIHYSNLWKPI